MPARKSKARSRGVREALPAQIVPPSLRTFVSKRVRQGGFEDERAYVRHLLEEDRRAVEAERRMVEALLREGAAAPLSELNEAWLSSVRAIIRRKPGARRRAG